MEHQNIVTFETELCIGCANCAQMCPDSVITIERRKRDEQSAYERK